MEREPQIRPFLFAIAALLGLFLVLAWTGVLGVGQWLARSPFWSLGSLLVFLPFFKYRRAGRPLLLVCGLWATVVWSNVILAGHQKVPATVVGMEVHFAMTEKDSNWAFIQFQSERGRLSDYFPIQARQLPAGETVTLSIATGLFWPRIEYVRSESWSGSANFF
ncbi:MAG: hypothetical protein KF760_34470 [Candidatus Eremiobacteraeota bacterium]|nr:hypothetical protein [Candidatus Eremiobacteraeota bacterium]MCW5868724.1 hypothetical protein [Candidatus Eremiobacteraeota bacterium]